MQENEDDKILKITTRLFMVIFIIVFITIVIRFLSKNILVDIMNVNNPFIQELAEDGRSQKAELIQIDWDKEYPIEDNQKDNEKNEIIKESIIDKYTNIINKVEGQLEKYSSEFLLGYEKIVEIAKSYENLINWNLITLNDLDTPIYMEDGYWSEINTKEEYTKQATNIIEFSNYVKEKNIDLIYIQAPKKTQDCSGEMFDIYTDYADENIDDLIKKLKENDINVLDLREKVREDKIEPKTLFYKTDHHWTPQAAIWAMNHITDRLNSDWKMNINKELYKMKNYYTINCNDTCLGSQGRKVTLAKANTENFDIVLPNFKTSITVTVPEKGIENKTGDVWETLFDKEELKKKDYYDSSEYSAYGYGNWSLVHAKNNNVKDGEKVLILADSFSGVLTPYLSLGVEEIYKLDLRKFNGSVKSFIEKNNITKVMMLYFPGIFQDELGNKLLEYN